MNQTNQMTTRPGSDLASTGAPRAAAEAALVPLVDVVEDEDGITLYADVPGASREGLRIDVDASTLTLEADISLGESASTNPLHLEIRAPLYRRQFTLSRELDTSAIDAGLSNGVLTLRIPKLAAARPRRVEVRGA